MTCQQQVYGVAYRFEADMVCLNQLSQWSESLLYR